MPTLILINGRPGAGKTSVGKELLTRLQAAAYFDFDFLIHVNPWNYGEELLDLGLRNASHLINEFFDSDYKAVIMCSGAGSAEQIAFLRSRLAKSVRIVWFFIDVSDEERRNRKAARGRDEADNVEAFDFVERKIGTYSGLPQLDDVSCHEIAGDGKSINLIVDEMIASPALPIKLAIVGRYLREKGDNCVQQE